MSETWKLVDRRRLQQSDPYLINHVYCQDINDKHTASETERNTCQINSLLDRVRKRRSPTPLIQGGGL